MAMPKEKTDPIKTRTPQKKTPGGIFDNLRSLPHPVEEILGIADTNLGIQPEPISLPEINTIADHGTVSDSNTVSSLDTVPPLDTVLQNNTAPNSNTVSLSKPVRKKAPTPESIQYRTDTVSQLDTVPSKDTVSNIVPVQLGFLELPHYISDALAPSLKPAEWAVYFQLYRLSHGWGRTDCIIGYKRLSERTNIKKTALRETLDSLINQGLIEEIETLNTKEIKGTRYKVLLRRKGDTVTESNTVLKIQTVSISETNKRHDHDHDSIKKNHHQDALLMSQEVGKFENWMMTKYESLTGNQWTKLDRRVLNDLGQGIQEVNTTDLEELMLSIAQRASAPIGSFKFFAIALQNELAEKPFLSQKHLRERYEACAKELSRIFVGKRWESESEKIYEFKRIVLKQMLPWKDDLANETLAA